MNRIMKHKLTGTAASPGYAIGRAIRLEQERYVPEPRTVDNAEQEWQRFREAAERARTELQHLRDRTEQRLGAEKADIFAGHLLLASDPDLLEGVRLKIAEERQSAETALHEVAQMYMDMLKAMDDELLQARATDIGDVSRRMMNQLRGVANREPEWTETGILVCEDLTPSDTAQLDLNVIQAFITEIGSRTSHSAIMARSMEIPAVVGVNGATDRIDDGEWVIVDAVEGAVIVSPDDDTRADYLARKEAYDRRRQALQRLRDQPTRSRDGRQVELAANIGGISDLEKVLENGAEGIGLFRTEFLYMDRADFPSEDEQLQVYRHVLQKMGDKPVVIRTLDIGGDKELSYMSLPKESNPFLGLRAIRLCLGREDLFRTQLRALLRASAHGNLKIMFPMISVAEELRQAKKLLYEEKQSLQSQGYSVSESVEIGMMVEVPSAAVAAHAFAPEVDFFSIGTNDLIQYTMAADRMNEAVSYLYQPCHPAILRLVKWVIDAAAGQGKWVGMCGEMAGDERAIPLLLGLGLHEFSMSASSILSARAQIAELDYAAWREHAAEALSMSDQDQVNQWVRRQTSGPSSL
ncbi:phosphoenolpyruvate--protein phosphotransferase [Cohnella boryungensis]|uniref:Phosphoenolpyruvate-protein phosphotransferase n=1 Tax=Cohnella boryungensis TaxID=768479 RepID=A0ABV8SBC9_9BACL